MGTLDIRREGKCEEGRAERKAKLERATEELEASEASLADMQREQKKIKSQYQQQQREWEETQANREQQKASEKLKTERKNLQ